MQFSPFILIGLAVGLPSVGLPQLPDAVIAFGLLGTALLAYFSFEVKILGKRYSAPKAVELWPAIMRPLGKASRDVAITPSNATTISSGVTVQDVHEPRPVLYFRSFDVDEAATKRIFVFGENASGWYIDRSEEELIGEAFKDFGPPIAVGQPSSEFPILGVARTCLENDEWQARVESWMQQAALIIIRAGFTPGLLWELSAARQHVNPKHIVLLIPFSKSEYEQFRVKTADIFPHALPAYRRHFVKRADINGIVYFDDHWHGTFVPLRGALHGYSDADLHNSLYDALRTVRARLGLFHLSPPRYAIRFHQIFLAIWAAGWFSLTPIFLLSGGIIGIIPFLCTVCILISIVLSGGLWREWDAWRPFGFCLTWPKPIN